VHAAAELARRAARSFAAAADRTAAADTAGSDQSRGEAESALTKLGAGARPCAPAGGDAGPGRALRAAAAAVRSAAASDTLRRAAAALAAAARAIPLPTL
ncbi:hypothetical protein J0H58_03245, partial [bacterium]|nr:hypothetical protein [bacterium]